MKKVLLVISVFLLFSCNKRDTVRTAKIEIITNTGCNVSYDNPSQKVKTTTTITGTNQQISDAINSLNSITSSSSNGITCDVVQSAKEIH